MGEECWGVEVNPRKKIMSASVFTIRGKFLEGNEVVGLELFGHDGLLSHLGQ